MSYKKIRERENYITDTNSYSGLKRQASFKNSKPQLISYDFATENNRSNNIGVFGAIAVIVILSLFAAVSVM